MICEYWSRQLPMLLICTCGLHRQFSVYVVSPKLGLPSCFTHAKRERDLRLPPNCLLCELCATQSGGSKPAVLWKKQASRYLFKPGMLVPLHTPKVRLILHI